MFYKRTCCENLKSWGRQTWVLSVHGRQFFAILAAVHSRAHARPTLSALSSVVDVRGRDKAAIRLKERERGEICRLLPTTWVQKFCTSAVLRATSNCHLWAHRGTRSVLKFTHDWNHSILRPKTFLIELVKRRFELWISFSRATTW